MTVDLKAGAPVKLKLTDCRRTQAAYVPPPAARRPVNETVVSPNSKVALLNQLRKLSEPDVQGVTLGFHGSSTGPGEATPPEAAPSSAPSAGDHVLYESKLSSFIKNSLDVTTQTVLSADRRSVRVEMTPMFNTVSDARPQVSSSAIPGGQ